MKKKILIITITILIITATTAMAMVSFDTFPFQKNQNEQQDPIVARERTDDTVSALTQSSTDEGLIDIMSQQGLYDDEMKLALEKYLNMVALYQPSKQEIKDIVSLVSQGYDLGKLTDIYIFMVDTEEGSKILFDVYNTGSQFDFSGANWIENAYNSVTSKKHGVLEMDKITAYVGEGITTDDIYVANFASRAGKMTIQEILDERTKGTSWSDILSDIYQGYKIDKTSMAQANGFEILQAFRDSLITGEDVSTMYDDSKNNQKEKINKYTSQKKHEVKQFLKDHGLLYEINDETIQKAQNELKDVVDAATVKALVMEGYTIKEIKRAAKSAEKTGLSINEILETYREKNTWPDKSRIGQDEEVE